VRFADDDCGRFGVRLGTRLADDDCVHDGARECFGRNRLSSPDR
jgi:hypothetical protein